MTDAEISAAWDAQASTLEDARRATGADDFAMTKACLDVIQTWIPPSLEPLRLLEIGCGVGRLTLPLARVNPRAVIVGVDASPKMLAYAREARDRHDVKNVRFIRACRPGPHGFGGPYHAAYSALTFQHMSPSLAREYFVAVGEALVPNGIFVFQFIEGSERQPLSNHFSAGEIVSWLRDGGMGVLDTAHGIGHPLWTWVCASKGRGAYDL